MARLLSLTVYAKDSNVYASPSIQAYNADTILYAENASLSQKMKFPAASGSISSVLTSNYDNNNSGERHCLYVGETLATMVTASA